MPQRTRVTKRIGRERRHIMSLLGWIITAVGAIALGFFGNELGLSRAKQLLASALLGVACLFIFPSGGNGGVEANQGGSSNSSIKQLVKYELIANTNYENIHVLDVNMVNVEDNYVTYKWNAEFKHLGILSRQSGYIYLYRNGDIKDFVMLNDIHVAK